ncbi:thymidylate synthase [bacterium]|nr:thymidylate synthase [bacterium]MDB4128691.1 thymidylate synthase [bacterium]MDC1257123.1 thymidylate synthase [bacterium]
MIQYLGALRYIRDFGEDVDDRTGVGTRSVFGHQMRFDLRKGFPAVTTKKLAWKSVVSELLWFLEGSINERRLAEIHFGDTKDNLVGKKTIWTANADNQGVALGHYNSDTNKDLGPVYGKQWRNFGGVDQIANIIDQIKNDPDSRRIILSAWNVPEIAKMALPPCHTMSQFKVINGKLSCQLYQRSADMFLGVPFNIASYSLLTHMLAQICDLEVGDFVWSGGDCHIYHNHLDQVNQQTIREPQKRPQLVMPEFKTLDQLLTTKPKEYILEGYTPMDTIKAPMAV